MTGSPPYSLHGGTTLANLRQGLVRLAGDSLLPASIYDVDRLVEAFRSEFFRWHKSISVPFIKGIASIAMSGYSRSIWVEQIFLALERSLNIGRGDFNDRAVEIASEDLTDRQAMILERIIAVLREGLEWDDEENRKTE